MKFRQEMGFAVDTPVIANIGMIRSDKGQMRLFEAAVTVLQHRPDARFIIVGKGTGDCARETRLREAIYDAGLENKVIMLGYRWDTPDILAAANMVVIASLCTEASPIVLREAFASGRPVVTTRIGDVPEIVHHGENGLVVQPSDTVAMANAILRFLSEPELAKTCAANALAYAGQHFSFDQMIRAKLDVDLSVLPRSVRAHATAPAAADLVSAD
jgi:glycosyltransferase involved in cell wall biosynthesis